MKTNNWAFSDKMKTNIYQFFDKTETNQYGQLTSLSKERKLRVDILESVIKLRDKVDVDVNVKKLRVEF